MSVRQIQGFLAEHYGTEVSPDFISSVTDEVMAEALSWQSRPLETMYPVVLFDALRVKIRDDGVVSNNPAAKHATISKLLRRNPTQLRTVIAKLRGTGDQQSSSKIIKDQL
jgi:hypothetical protein